MKPKCINFHQNFNNMRIIYHKMFLILTVLIAMIFIGSCRETLHRAIERHDIKAVRRLIDNGADVNARNEDGKTPLHIAAYVAQLDAANLLILNGADINAKDDIGWTPLHAACINSWLTARVAKLLIFKGADIHARTEDDATPLHAAAMGGHNDTVKLLIQKGADVNARTKVGDTPLHWSARRCKYDQEETVKALLSAGAEVLVKNRNGFTPLEDALVWDNKKVADLLAETIDLEALDDSGDTPLHWSIRKHNLKMVKLFIEHGADINAKDSQGNKPLDVAHLIRNKDIIGLLESKGAKKSPEKKHQPVPTISQEEFLKNLEKLISEGGDINALDSEGKTLLHDAAIYGFEDAVRFLLNKGANPNATADVDLTPLHIALSRSNLEMTKMLIDHGADVNMARKGGFTPLGLAVTAQHNRLELSELLIDSGANINIAAEHVDGQTPLHMSVSSVFGGKLPLIKLLLEKGADVNSRDRSGATPLHEATRRGYKEIVELLIENNAEINAVDNEGMTPLDYASSDDPQVQAVYEILRRHGGKTSGRQRKFE